MKPIIESILDTDLYKLSMQQVVLHQYPDVSSEYIFKCRDKGVKLGFLADQIQEEVNAMADIALTELEEDYCKESLTFLSPDYIDYLKKYRFNPWEVKINNVDGDLDIRTKGPWVSAILWEVPLLSIVNELYFRETSDSKTIEGEGIRRLKDKINLIRQYPTLTFAEFGTRRRYSRAWQSYIVNELHKNCPQLIGTSNVRLAMDLNVKPIGTQAHEFFSAHLALVDDVRQAQKRAFHVWLQEYGVDLGIALSDTFTTKAFFEDFDIVLAREFAGVRQDSGNPFEFGKNMIAHYQKLGIDPRTKTVVFSDGLDVPIMIKIFKEFTGNVGVSFGVGTNLTNSLGVTPLNIVIKLVECNGIAVAKLSDDLGKAMGSSSMIDRIKKAYNIK